MSKSNNLFDLIKAMDRGEKRYFKLFAATFEGENKNYITLFDAIAKQEKYDEKALKKKFANASFIKHFAVVKNQLFNNIMRAMRLYYDNSSDSEKINTLHHNSVILQKKNLVQLSLEQLEKALKIARKNEMAAALLMLTHDRNQKLVHQKFEGYTYMKMIAKLDEAYIASKCFTSLTECMRLSMEIDYLIFQHSFRDQEIQDRISTLSKHEILKDDASPVFAQAKFFYHHCRVCCAFVRKNYQKFYDECFAIEQLFSQRLLKKELDSGGYIIIINNLLFGAIRVKPFNEVEQLAERYKQELLEFKQKKINAYNFELNFFKATCQYKMGYYLFNRQVDKLPMIVDEFDEHLNKIEDQLSVFFRIKFEYQLACAYWLTGELEKATDLVNGMLNSGNIKNHKEYYAANLILNLLLLYQNEAYEHLSYQIRNCRQTLKRYNYFYDYEEVLINMLSQLLKNKDKVSVLESYRNKFEEMKSDISQLDAFEKIDILYWIEKELGKFR